MHYRIYHSFYARWFDCILKFFLATSSTFSLHFNSINLQFYWSENWFVMKFALMILLNLISIWFQSIWLLRLILLLLLNSVFFQIILLFRYLLWITLLFFSLLFISLLFTLVWIELIGIIILPFLSVDYADSCVY